MQCEVLVVGGGPAGSTAARLLAEKGIETVLIEKDLTFNKPCGGGIPSAGLKEFNILNKLQNQIPFNIVTKVKIFPPFSEPIEVSLQGGEILIFNRQSFDSFMRNLAEKSGVKIIEGELINIDNGKLTVRKKLVKFWKFILNISLLLMELTQEYALLKGGQNLNTTGQLVYISLKTL